MAISSSFSAGVLTLAGDALDNTIQASRDAAGAILINGGAVVTQGGPPTIANTSVMNIAGNDGADTITLSETNGALPTASISGGFNKDALGFNGSAASERFELRADGTHVLVSHDGQSAIDMNGVEFIELTASAGRDTVIVNDLSGTDVVQLAIYLGSGGETDQIGLNATNGNDVIRVASIEGEGAVAVWGLHAVMAALDADTADQLTINGGSGNDTIDASAVSVGAIALILQGGVGADALVGSAGVDTATYAASSAGVAVDLGAGSASGGDATGDTLTGIENLIGSTQGDILAGDAGSNVLTGGGGADTLAGRAGDDELNGGDGDDTAVFNVDFNSVKVTFFGERIFIDSAEGRDVLTGIEHFRFTDGTIDRADGSPLVDDLFYYAANRDVWDAGVDAEDHYNAFGWREGRDPSSAFSTNGYLSANADVRAAGVNPLEHYDVFGWKEGRDPSAGFDTGRYLERNPDAAAAGVNPLAHFLALGRDEGRKSPATVGQVDQFGFDAEFYLLQNPDVGFAGVDPLLHFQIFGAKEGRSPNAFFNTKGYLAAYGDVAAAGVNPLEHYMQFGAHEGRDPSAAFDTIDYLAANPDVAAAGVNPLEHFLVFGIHEGRPSLGDGLFR